MPQDFTARYEKETTVNGNRYTFFCGVSGVAVHTTGFIFADVPQAARDIAWREARPYFNRCKECGKWIADAVYNIEESKCVVCAPFAVTPSYCPECGSPLEKDGGECLHCRFKVTAQKSGKSESA
jgi:hypothetical protein